MNKDELIAAIAERDADVKIEGLRVKELGLILGGLTLPGKVKELEGDIAELNKSLADAEAAPKENDGRTFVGEHEGKKVYMTIPAARIAGKVVKASEINETQLQLAIDAKAQYLIFE